MADSFSTGAPPQEAGRVYGPILPGRTYRYEMENFHSGRGHFIWLPDLGRLALISSQHLEGGEVDVTPPAGVSTETFLGLRVGRDLYLIDLGTPAHLGLPAFTSLTAED